MRFRHKLSIVLVMLVLVPLVTGAFLLNAVLADSERDDVDSRLSSSASGAVVAYNAQLASAQQLATDVAGRPEVQRALEDGEPVVTDLSNVPDGVRVIFTAGSDPVPVVTEPHWQTTAEVGEPVVGGVTVVVVLDDALLTRIALASPRADGVDLALVDDGVAVAATNGRTGETSGLEPGLPLDASIAGSAVRARATGVDSTGSTAELAATYPLAELDDRIDSLRLQVLLGALVLGAILVALALLVADRSTGALRDLAARANAILRSSGGRAPEGSDELEDLGSALDVMSSELSTRMTELEGERERLKSTLARYGETLAATHDLRALVEAVLDTAVQATRARGGRLLLYEADRGEAAEHARIGTARGSRTDLPMVVPAGRGLEGEVIQSQSPRSVPGPRPMMSVPVLREKQLLGLVTVVDPEEGHFGEHDMETLSGLAVQAAVAIENARLHRQVEQQAITDELSGLANRRQFFDVLGREYERAQRFGQPLSLILLDIDDFKRVNDTPELGHLAGDAVIRSIAATIGGMIREIDLAARYGGEEFAVLLPQTDREGAVQLAERLRAAIAERHVPFGDFLIDDITASFGVATGPGDDAGQLDLIAAADSALYRAKRQGKNFVSVEE